MTEALLRAYLFAELLPAEIAGTAAASTLRHLDRGEAAFSVGQPADALFVVVDGQLKERLVNAEGDESVFELYTAGGVFGEPGLFVPERDRMVDMVALTTSHLLVVPRAALLDVMRRCPGVAMRLIEGLASDVRAIGVQLANAGHLTVKQRLAAKLLELSRTHGRQAGPFTCLELSLSQGLLATMVAATRENVNRALADLDSSGAVTTDGRRYLVDPRLLQQAANCDDPLPRRNRLASGHERG